VSTKKLPAPWRVKTLPNTYFNLYSFGYIIQDLIKLSVLGIVGGSFGGIVYFAYYLLRANVFSTETPLASINEA
jgi:hypothetical protein